MMDNAQRIGQEIDIETTQNRDIEAGSDIPGIIIHELN